MNTGGEQKTAEEGVKNTYYIEINSSDNSLFCKEYIYEITHYRFNWHRTIEIMVIMEGMAEVCAGGKTYKLTEDDILIINSNVGHGSFAGNEETIAFVFQLDPVYFEKMFPHFETIYFTKERPGEEEDGDLCISIRYYMSMLMRLIYEKKGIKSNGDIGIAILLVSELLGRLPYELNSGFRQARGEKSRKVIRKILKYTESHYKDKITLEDLARMTGYNRTYLSTAFKKNVGINYYDYLTMLRIRHTLAELNHSSRPITDIALDYGFPNVNAFTEAFKRNFKQSPNEYRNRLKGEVPLKEYLPYRKDIVIGHPLVEQQLKNYENRFRGQEENREGEEYGIEYNAEYSQESQTFTVDDEVKELIKTLYAKVSNRT